MSKLIPEKNAGINHIKNLAFNRKASTTGETKAIQYIEKELNNEGINTIREYFEWNSQISIMIRIGYLIILINLIIFRQILIIVAFFIIKNLSQKLKNLSLIPRETSKNLELWINDKEKKQKRPLIIFTAHYDSITVIIPYKLQLIVFTFYRIITGIYIGIIILLLINFFIGFFNPIANFNFFLLMDIILSVFGILISIPLLLLVLKEKGSYGSIDNASGVSITIELAKLLKKNPLKNYDVLFLWTGAEEWGMRGSKYFTKNFYWKLEKNQDLNKSININIDMVGSYIGLLCKRGIFKKDLNDNINQIITSCAQKLNIPIDCYWKLINIKSDHKSFKYFERKTDGNFQIVCFHSDKDSKYIHSSKDSPEKCSSEIINNCIYLCYESVREIDSNL